jgi:tRNA threonylcarbamoyladenosine biosynthesis protein TsaE
MPTISVPANSTLRSASAAATFDVGRRLGAAAAAGQVIALHGDLGAGKTTLSQGIAAGLGIVARVTSPTFIFVAEYLGTRRLRLVHIDAYRLDEAPAIALREAGAFGLDDLLAGAGLPDADAGGCVVVIEWAERVAPALPEDRLDIYLRHDPANPAARVLDLVAHGLQSARLLAAVDP